MDGIPTANETMQLRCGRLLWKTTFDCWTITFDRTTYSSYRCYLKSKFRPTTRTSLMIDRLTFSTEMPFIGWHRSLNFIHASWGNLRTYCSVPSTTSWDGSALYRLAVGAYRHHHSGPLWQISCYWRCSPENPREFIQPQYFLEITICKKTSVRSYTLHSSSIPLFLIFFSTYWHSTEECYQNRSLLLGKILMYWLCYQLFNLSIVFSFFAPWPKSALWLRSNLFLTDGHPKSLALFVVKNLNVALYHLVAEFLYANDGLNYGYCR